METDLTNYIQHRMQKALFRIAFVFVLLFVCSFSFPHEYILDIGHYMHRFFERIVMWVGNDILHIKRPYTSELVSDSTGMYIHVLVLLVISIVAGLVWGLIDKPKDYSALRYWFIVFVRYYLAMQLLGYGWNKVFKWQFYLPEPNTLFTPLGYVHNDLLYWSAMGMSRSYSIFTGSLEVLAALLLFFRRTQLIGALIALGVMVNVLMINIGFDISVKLYSAFLLFLCLMVIKPYARRLYCLLLGNSNNYNFSSFRYPVFKKEWLHLIVKCSVILFLLADSLAIYFSSRNFNDDKAARPYLHGAYQVETFISNGDTLLPLTTDHYRWRRMFIHRQGYLIVQSMDDSMKDYELYNDSLQHELLLKDPEDTSSLHVFKYINMADTALQLNGRMYDNSMSIYLKKIDLQQLPLMKNEFHWTIDE